MRKFVLLIASIICIVTLCSCEKNNSTPTELAVVVGSWHMKSFCGADADIDLYIRFSRNNTFKILQRTDSLEYTEYNGTYEIDDENSIISGVYSDGESWTDSYRFSLNSDNELVLESLNSAEISVYESSTMPKLPTLQKLQSIGIDTRTAKPL